MELTLLDWIIIAAFFVVSLVIGLMYTKQAGQSIDSYFLGGRNLTWWIAGTSMVATTFAADTPLAVNELVAKNGVAGNWLWWNMMAGGMLTTFFFARMWRRANIMTDVEFIELRYSGKAAAFLRGFKAVYLGIFMNAVVIGWVNKALMTLLEVFFDIPQNYLLFYVAAAMLIVVAYSSLSGLMGVAITDVVQFIIAMTGCIVLAIIVVNSPKIGGISGLKAQLPAWSLDFFPKVDMDSAGDVATTLTLSMGTFFAFTAMQWWASWYPGAEPGGGGYVAQRMMSAKNERHAILASLFFQIAHFCLRPWPWILVGLCSVILYPNIENKGMGYVLAMKEFLPSGLRGLLLVAFLAAYMSTISTQLNWGASYIINDLYRRFMSPRATEKGLVAASRVATVVMMAVSLYITSLIDSISGVWQFLIEGSAGIGLVLILRWYWWRVNAWSEIISTLAPLLAYAVLRYSGLFPENLAIFPNSFFITVGFTTLSWLTATYLTKPTDAAVLKRFYERVQPQGWWKPVSSQLAMPAQKSTMRVLFVCWLLAIIIGYSILFCIGKLIFQEWSSALAYGFVAGLAALVFNFLTKKIKVFESEKLENV